MATRRSTRRLIKQEPEQQMDVDQPEPFALAKDSTPEISTPSAYRRKRSTKPSPHMTLSDIVYRDPGSFAQLFAIMSHNAQDTEKLVDELTHAVLPKNMNPEMRACVLEHMKNTDPETLQMQRGIPDKAKNRRLPISQEDRPNLVSLCKIHRAKELTEKLVHTPDQSHENWAREANKKINELAEQMAEGMVALGSTYNIPT